MKIFHSMNPHALFSEFTGPRLLNFAGEGGEQGKGSRQSEDDEPDPNTPAGKKWALQKQRIKDAEEEARVAKERAIRAEAKAEAIEDLKKQFGLDAANRKDPKRAKDDEPNDDDDDARDINPDDEKYVGKIIGRHMKKLGLDKIPEVVEALNQNTQQIQATTAIERAKRDLDAEFADSVPFNYDEALKYAKEKGYGLVASTVKDALRMAHKEMNEEAFIEHWKGGAKPKKKVPKMVHSGRGDTDDELINLDNEKDDEFEINSFDDMRRLGTKVLAGEAGDE